MTGPTEFELLELATPYALNAISDTEHAAIDRQLAAAPAAVARPSATRCARSVKRWR